MADFAIITNKQLAETGRWDAAYNIQYFRHKDKLQKLLAAKSRETLIMAAKSVPYDVHAARVVSGCTRINISDRWTDNELGLYIIQLQASGILAEKSEQMRADAVRKLSAITDVITELESYDD